MVGFAYANDSVPPNMRSLRHLLVFLLTSSVSLSALPTQAQITPDQTLGPEQSIVTPNVGTRGELFDSIEGGAVRGENLFHSFEEFNVGENRGAYFFNPEAAIQNILTRVTGEANSTILGTLGTFGQGEPNLFFMNPNGIIFGENASLNMQGSFLATTADRISFENIGDFRANDQGTPSELLTVNPSVFHFSTAPQGTITNRSTATQTIFEEPTFGLQVPDGKTITLLGGDVLIEGGVIGTFGGRTEVGSVVDTGNVELNLNGFLQFPSATKRGNVMLTQQSLLFGVPRDDGGDVSIIAGNILVSENSQLLGGVFRGLSNEGSQAGDLDLDATEEILLEEGGTIANNINEAAGDTGNLNISAKYISLNNGFISSSVSPKGLGESGNVNIQADFIELSDGGQLSTTISGSGNSGDITIDAKERLLIYGTDASGRFSSSILSSVDAGGEGSGGNIFIQAGSLEVADGGQLGASNSGSGNSGEILIVVEERLVIDGTDQSGRFSSSISSGTNFGGDGDGGDILIRADSLEVINGGQLSVTSSGVGNSGEIAIDVKERLIVDGTDASGRFSSSISSSISPEGAGNGGDISIRAFSLELLDGGLLAASSSGFGDGGNITIAVEDQTIIEGIGLDGMFSSGIFSVNLDGDGNGGNIEIDAGNSLRITNGGQLSADTSGRGEGGNVFINARNFVELSSTIGDISSTIGTRTVSDGVGGNILIRTGLLNITEDAVLSAETISDGAGGSVLIDVENLNLLLGGSLVASTASNGEPGQISIRATNQIFIDGSGKNGTPSQLRVRFNPSSTPGEIELDAKILFLDNKGEITAVAPSGDGGNLNLNIHNLLLLRHGSQISVTAGTETQNGNGGNIIINTPFLLAIPEENSDITANAFQGDGGNIDIEARGIFGIKPRSQPTEFSDITASSESGISGSLALSTSDTGFIENNVTELSDTLINSETLVANSCIVHSDDATGSFAFTGSDRLPQTPTEASLNPYPTGTVQPTLSSAAEPVTITEPQAVYRLADGRLVISRDCEG